MPSTRLRQGFLACLLINACFAVAAEDVLPEVEAKGRYAVVASTETAEAEGWNDVVAALRAKHDAALILYPKGQVAAVIPALRKLHPRYAAFVAPPEEAGRQFVVTIHRLTRKLDDDPYTDLRWGILTGYEAADALRIAKRTKPLVVRSAASSMGPGIFKSLEHGFASNEVNAKDFWIKKKGGETEKLEVSPDPVKQMVEAFNTQSPDMFVTSGHASERNWQVIYNKNIGFFRHEKGQLYGHNQKKKRFGINSPEPKIYLPVGNCLIGHIDKPDCMATAWMHSGGVHQMFGYTAVTFHGYMGWGMGSFFNNQYTLSEAFFFNNQSLIWELQQEFPEKAGIEFDAFGQRDVGRLARTHQLKDRKLLGHLWDRDVVAFYGDPAWEARHRLESPAWRVDWKHEGESVTVTVNVLKDGKWSNRPLAIPFPTRLGRIRGVNCTPEMTPLVTDDFALLPVMGKERKAGESIVLTFGGFAVDAVTTSAGDDPIVVKAEQAKAPPRSRTLDLGKVGLSEGAARKVAFALRAAQENAMELANAIRQSSGEEAKEVCYLIANMSLRDLREVKAELLLNTVRGARKALEEAPWKETISPELYREAILPYANLSEKREDWRGKFHAECKPMVAGIDSPGDAAVKLNQTIYDHFGVKYHAAKRPRPDQGPLESIEAGYASCTGLSVLLVNACRAVGIPARIAGVAQWTRGKGNHTWVEVWDDGWHCLGASESKALNKVWFGKGVAAADETDPMKRIYAAQFSRTTQYFPLAWNPYDNSIPAVDVTLRYKKQFAHLLEGEPTADAGGK